MNPTECTPVDVSSIDWSANKRDVLVYRGYRIVKLDDNLQLVQHVNGIALLTLAQTHPVLHNNSTVTHVDFQPGGTQSRDYSGLAVGGKRKRGAAQMQADTKLCKVTMNDGQMFVIRTGVKCRVLEANSRLSTKPDLLRTQPTDQGFIAVLSGCGAKP